MQIVGAQHVKAAAIGYNQGHSKENSQTTAAQSSFDVVCRAAVAAVRTTFFVNLCQGAFNKSRSAADNSNNPHPEHSTIAAEADSCGNTDNITGTYTGRSRYHQSLERRNRTGFNRLLQNNANSFPKQTYLHQTSTQRVVQAYTDEHNNQQITIHKIADCSNDFTEHKCCSPFFSLLVNYNIFICFSKIQKGRQSAKLTLLCNIIN